MGGSESLGSVAVRDMEGKRRWSISQSEGVVSSLKTQCVYSSLVLLIFGVEFGVLAMRSVGGCVIELGRLAGTSQELTLAYGFTFSLYT